jgi:hypothetical protein
VASVADDPGLVLVLELVLELELVLDFFFAADGAC